MYNACVCVCVRACDVYLFDICKPVLFRSFAISRSCINKGSIEGKNSRNNIARGVCLGRFESVY